MEEGVEEVEEVEEATEEDMISALRNGVAGAAPAPTVSRTAGRKIATVLNEYGIVISNFPTAINVENWDT
jgi:hypothetical protein